MKVALCCIGKCENDYIEEYVEYYRNLGVDKIFLYDNNDVDGERFENKIQTFIDDDFVELIDYRGEKVCQLKAYQECYDNHKNEYDWLIFADCGDAYLDFNTNTQFNNVKTYLEEDQFSGFSLIKINWMVYGDNDKVFKEDGLLRERFPKPMPFSQCVGYDFPENNHVFSIVRGGCEVSWDNTPHAPSMSKKYKACNANGEEVKSSDCPFEKLDFSQAFFKHYTTKSTEEYCRKVMRGFPDQIVDERRRIFLLKERYFKANKVTRTKLNLIKKNLNIDLSSLYDMNVADKLDIFVNAIEGSYVDLSNDVYKILELGGCDLGARTTLERYKDNSGDNISYLNKSICEFTGMYWVNKNFPLKEYVGFCQYRKYFSFFDNLPNIEKIFENNDVILCEPYKVRESVREHYAECHNIEDYDKLKEIINEVAPQYNSAFEKISNSNCLFICNLFIMKKDDFKKYCEFIWLIISKFLVDENIHTYEDCVRRVEDNKTKYIKKFYPNDTLDYQSRFIAYLIERLTNVFICEHFKKAYLFKMKEVYGKY